MDVSDEIRNRRRTFRGALATATANLEKIKSKYGKDSDEYIRAKRGVDAYGTEHDGNKVRVATVADSKQNSSAHVAPKDSNGLVTITFKESSLNLDAAIGPYSSANTKQSLLGHEGFHIADSLDGKKLDNYESEYYGNFVQAVLEEVQFPNEDRGIDVGVKSATIPTGIIDNWNPSWGTIDQIRTERHNAVNTLVTLFPEDGGIYNYAPPAKSIR